MTERRNLVLVLAGLAVLSLAACSSNGGSSGGEPPVGSPGGSLAAASPASGTSDGTQIDPCAVVSPAQVQPLQTAKLGKPTASTEALYGTSPRHDCTYHSANGDTAITVGVYVGSQASTVYAQDRQSRGAPTAVPGVGDQAVRGDETPDLTAVHGNTICTVVVADPGTVPGAARLYHENGHHTDIGAPAFDIIAKGFGTLCNRIFGTGSTSVDLSGLAGLHPPKA